MARGAPLNGAKPKCGALPSKCGSTLNMAANIKVVVRVRPLNDREKAANNRVVVDVVDDTMLVFDPKEEMRPFFYQGVQQPTKNVLRRANKELKFVFDNVCGLTATNKDIFELTTKDVLTSLMEGYNCSVFVYGATGAGKTFTMIGSKENPGITYLTMEHLFYTINSFEKDRDFDIGVSYIEVYNENVFDLLKPSKTPLQLREDNKYGVMVAGLTLENINTARELLNMLENGNKNRTQHPTDANAESSRSHAVFQVYIKMRYKTSGQVRVVKLSMIDLAGSERASATGCVGERFKEGANINRSLLSLGNCINKLADGSSYIPYRDSKLTRLLKDSLGGNCKTVMIANISPSSVSYEDTYNTLKYAARANKIQLSIKKNIVDGDVKLSQYVKIVDELKKKVKELEAKLSLSTVTPAPVKEQPNLAKEKAKTEWRRRIVEEEKRHAAVEAQLLALRSRGRVLALRRRLRARAFAHLADLAHRSSNDAMELMVTEDIPRQERAAESYEKKAQNLDAEILLAKAKCDESWRHLKVTLEQAVADCPDLRDFTNQIVLQRNLTLSARTSDLKDKLLCIMNKEVDMFSEYTCDMPRMLRKLYLTLKGYDKVPPALAAEYIDLMKKAKSMKSISWDTDSEVNDPHLESVSRLDLDVPLFDPLNMNVEMVTDSDDLTDVENREVSPKKRKGTPIKLGNNETIVIDDSFQDLDATKIINSAKKLKREHRVVSDVENVGVIDPNDVLDVENVGLIDPNGLNSTFVLAGKMEAMKKVKVEPNFKAEPHGKAVPALTRRGLTDRTNVQRTINFNDKAKAVKPMASKALVARRAAPGFGSGLARDGKPLARPAPVVKPGERSVYKAVRPRDRPGAHPYSRPGAVRR